MYIKKIKLHNYRRFKDLEISFNERRNILVGDNESGKSSILEAIDLTARGSRHRVEEIGIETLFNVEVIKDFMAGSRHLDELPSLYVELYLADIIEEGLEGKCNSEEVVTYGIRMTIERNDSLSRQTQTVLQSKNASFPFEFYNITFLTFSEEPYNGYTKKVKTIFLDNSIIGNDYALNGYISTIYDATLNQIEQLATKHVYGTAKTTFKNDVLASFNSRLPEGYAFSVKNTGKNC